LGDTYHNRYSPKSPYKGDKKYKKLKMKCSVCGTTKGPFDIHHTSNNRKDLKSGKGLKVMCRSCHRKYHAKMNGGKGALVVSSAARIIEDPKTPESLAIANKHKNSDIIHVEFILCHANRNDNGDEFTKEDLKESHQTAVHKPINSRHTLKNIGVIYEAKYVPVDEVAEADKSYYSEFDPMEDDFVVCKAVIWEYKHPDEARSMKERASEGKLFFSMENLFEKAQCSKCKEVFDSPVEYCDHLISRAQNKDYSRLFINSNFIGAAETIIPADQRAGTLAIASKEFAPVFSKLLQCSLLKNISISQSIVPYILRLGVDMKIEKKNIQEELLSFSSDDLPDESFADQTNRLFPIDNEANITESASYILNNSLEDYSETEKLILVERLSVAAKNYEIDLSEYQELGGNEKMSDIKITETPEFKEAVQKAVAEKMKEIENGETVANLQKSVADLEKTIEGLNDDLKKAKEAKATVENEFTKYKEDIATKETVAKRMSELKDIEIDNEDYVKKYAAEASDEDFESWKKMLIANAAKKKELTDEEKKKLKEEEMKNKAKASDDVTDDNTAIASKTSDPGTETHKSDTPGVDAVFQEALN